jgi:hypothetical protein
VSKFVPPTEAKVKAPAIDPEAAWRALTESLIFAAPYGTAEFLSILDATGRPYDREDAIRRCELLAMAITTDYPRQFKLQSCHAANDASVFRLRYGHLLPKRPSLSAPSTRRMGPSLEARQEAADEIASQW